MGAGEIQGKRTRGIQGIRLGDRLTSITQTPEKGKLAKANVSNPPPLLFIRSPVELRGLRGHDHCIGHDNGYRPFSRLTPLALGGALRAIPLPISLSSLCRLFQLRRLKRIFQSATGNHEKCISGREQQGYSDCLSRGAELLDATEGDTGKGDLQPNPLLAKHAASLATHASVLSCARPLLRHSSSAALVSQWRSYRLVLQQAFEMQSEFHLQQLSMNLDDLRVCL